MLTACSQATLSNDSIAVGRLGLPELEREPRRHISEERSREKLREHWSQPIVNEYEEFHLSLKRLARRRYTTMAVFPMPPEEENTRGVKLSLSTSRTRSSYAWRFSPSCLRKVAARLVDWLLLAKTLKTRTSKNSDDNNPRGRQLQRAALISTLASSTCTADL